MGGKYVQSFDFPASFGFTGSRQGNDAPRNQQTSDDGEHDTGTFVQKMARGGKAVRKMADGGMVIPDQVHGAATPGQASMQGGPLSRATITMPATDAAQLAQGLVQQGQKQGAQAALSGLAQAAQARRQGVPLASAPQAMAPVAQPAMAPAQTGVPAMARGGHLSMKQRNAMPQKDFALPGGRYPINDKGHGRAALSRVSANGTSAEKAEVRAAVHRKFPSIGKNKE